MVDSLILAYLAGIIDGEGCIAIYGYHGNWIMSHGKRHRGFRLDVKVGMGEPEAVQLLMKTFGGSIYVRKITPNGNKPSYSWTVSAKLAIACLRQLIPFLRVKKAQAEIALEFWDVREAMGHKYGWNPYSESEFAKLVDYGEKLKQEKRVVVPLRAATN